jgi:hypothetical protein
MKTQMGSIELYHKQIMITTDVSGTWQYDHKGLHNTNYRN